MNCAVGVIGNPVCIVTPIYFMIRDYPKAIIAWSSLDQTSTILKNLPGWIKIRKIPN